MEREVNSALKCFPGILAGALLIAADGGLIAGEKIRFSGRDKDSDAPAAPREREMFAPNATGGFRPKPAETPDFVSAGEASAPAPRTKKQLQTQDEKENWMFENYQTVTRKSAPKETLDKKDSAAKEKKPAMERFIEDQKNKAGGATNHVAANYPPGGRPELDRNPGEPRENLPATHAESRLPRLPGELSSGASGLRDGPATARTGSERSPRMSERLAQREARTEEFRKLLDFSNGAAGSTRSGNAGGLTSDTGGKGLNFSGPRAFGDLPRLNGLPGDSSPLPGAGGRPDRLGGLDNGLPKAFGAPSTGSELKSADDSLRIQSKPAVLEIPKRKF